MTVNRPVVFVSHAATDGNIATLFKDDLERNFLGLCNVFVSSSLDSLSAGEEWIKKIKNSLAEAKIIIGLISPTAIQRGWVYFEFGAGWLKEIPVIPVCHSGLRKDMLPPPLSIFQALDLTDEHHLKHLYGQIATSLQCQVPTIDFSKLAASYHEITEAKRIANEIKIWMEKIISLNPFFPDLLSGKIAESEILIPSNMEHEFYRFKAICDKEEYLSIEPRGMGMGTRVGAMASIFNVKKGGHFSSMPI